jgi:hypothetical protein
MPTNQAPVILCLASGVGELAMARSGDQAVSFYSEADSKLQEVEKIQPNLGLLRSV